MSHLIYCDEWRRGYNVPNAISAAFGKKDKDWKGRREGAILLDPGEAIRPPVITEEGYLVGMKKKEEDGVAFQALEIITLNDVLSEMTFKPAEMPDMSHVRRLPPLAVVSCKSMEGRENDLTYLSFGAWDILWVPKKHQRCVRSRVLMLERLFRCFSFFVRTSAAEALMAAMKGRSLDWLQEHSPCIGPCIGDDFIWPAIMWMGKGQKPPKLHREYTVKRNTDTIMEARSVDPEPAFVWNPPR